MKLNRNPKGIDKVCKSCKKITHYRFKEYIKEICEECNLDLSLIKVYQERIKERRKKYIYNMKLTLPSEKLINK